MTTYIDQFPDTGILPNGYALFMAQFDAGVGSIQTLRPQSSPRSPIQKSTHIQQIR